MNKKAGTYLSQGAIGAVLFTSFMGVAALFFRWYVVLERDQAFLVGVSISLCALSVLASIYGVGMVVFSMLEMFASWKHRVFKNEEKAVHFLGDKLL